MKRILPIILVLFLFFFFYYFYNITEKKENNLLFVGDSVLNNEFYSKIGNTCYVNSDYRSIDVLNILKYNEEIDCNGRVSLHRLLNNSNILTISIGYNDILANINDDTRLFYSELSDIIKNINNILDIISKYDFDIVLFLGFYKMNEKKSDYINYLNYNMRKILRKYNYEYVDLNSFINEYSGNESNKNTLSDTDYCKLNKILVEKYKKY